METPLVAEKQASVADLTREAYDEELVQLNRLLAGARAEHRRARDALDDGEAEYVGTRERREMVLGENARLISQCQQSVDRLSVDKKRLAAEVKSHWDVVDELQESRQVQYERMLARLKDETDFARTRFNTATQMIENRATMMDKITRVLENSSDLKQKQLEGMYANRQIFACSMHNYTEELEKYIGKFFETALLGRSDKRNKQIKQNIKEYYNIVKQFDEYRRKYISPKDDQRLPKLYEQQINRIIKLRTQWMMTNKLRKKNAVPEKSEDFYQEHSNDTIVLQTENSIYEEPISEFQDELTSVTQQINIINEDTQQSIIAEIEPREWKCRYLKELIDEIRTVADKANQYLAGEGRSTPYDPTDFEWLLNKGAVRHFSTCKTASIQTYDYDVKLNINRSYSECNSNDLE